MFARVLWASRYPIAVAVAGICAAATALLIYGAGGRGVKALILAAANIFHQPKPAKPKNGTAEETSGP